MNHANTIVRVYVKKAANMKFNHEAPFRNPAGDVITMKAKVTMHGVVHIECYENSER